MLLLLYLLLYNQAKYLLLYAWGAGDLIVLTVTQDNSRQCSVERLPDFGDTDDRDGVPDRDRFQAIVPAYSALTDILASDRARAQICTCNDAQVEHLVLMS